MTEETDAPKKRTRKKTPSRTSTQRKRHTKETSEETGKVVEMFPDQEPKDRGRVPAGGVNSAFKDEEGNKQDARARETLRLGKRWSQILREIREGMYTWDEFVEDLTPEELVRGQLADKNGDFRGRPPDMVPKAFHQACMRQLKTRFDQTLQTNLLKATDELIALGSNPAVDASTRAKVLTYLIERVMGKVPDKIEVSAADPWEQIISGIVTEVEDEKIGAAQEYLNRQS